MPTETKRATSRASWCPRRRGNPQAPARSSHSLTRPSPVSGPEADESPENMRAVYHRSLISPSQSLSQVVLARAPRRLRSPHRLQVDVRDIARAISKPRRKIRGMLEAAADSPPSPARPVVSPSLEEDEDRGTMEDDDFEEPLSAKPVRRSSPRAAFSLAQVCAFRSRKASGLPLVPPSQPRASPPQQQQQEQPRQRCRGHQRPVAL